MTPETILSPKQKSRRKEWKIFGWALLLAVVLWFLVAMGDTYTRRIDVRVTYTNLPKDKVFIIPLPKEYRVLVNAKGWDIMAIWMQGGVDNVQLDITSFKRRNYILTDRLKEEFHSQMPRKMVVSDIFPDTIHLAKETRLLKKVPIAVKIQLGFTKGFNLEDKLQPNPDSVELSGPASIIGSITEIETTPAIYKDVQKDFSVTLPLKLPEGNNISFTADKTQIEVGVSELKERTLEVPITILHRNEKRDVTLLTDKTTLTFLSPIDKKVPPVSDFKVVIDAEKLSLGFHKTAKLKMQSKPENVYNLRMKPETVQYNLKKK